MEESQELQSKFDENYFSSEAYSSVSFNRFSQYWWSNRFYSMLINKYGPASGRVLELGCGLGHLLGWLVDQYEIYGTDINPWALFQACKNVPRGRFLLLSAEDLSAFPEQVFQVVNRENIIIIRFPSFCYAPLAIG